MPNQPVFGTLYTLDRFVYRQNSTLLYFTIKETIILKIACFGVIYVPFSRVIMRYNVYFFTRVALTRRSPTYAKRKGRMCVVWAICDNNPHSIPDIPKRDTYIYIFISASCKHQHLHSTTDDLVMGLKGLTES